MSNYLGDPMQMGALINTATGTTTIPSQWPYTSPYPTPTWEPSTLAPDYRDQRIAGLEHALHEAHAEIGRMYEQLRGTIAMMQHNAERLAMIETQQAVAKAAP